MTPVRVTKNVSVLTGHRVAIQWYCSIWSINFVPSCRLAYHTKRNAVSTRLQSLWNSSRNFKKYWSNKTMTPYSTPLTVVTVCWLSGRNRNKGFLWGHSDVGTAAIDLVAFSIVKPTWCTFYSVYWELRACTCFEHYLRILRSRCTNGTWHIE
jgi:hypothetical protein